MDSTTEPASVKVLLKSGEGVHIEWKDGHRSEYKFDYLREQCPCATCRETEPAAPSALPLYKEKARATGAEAVGHYAIRFQFSDGHNTGIYSFELFREICPCAECAAGKAG